MLKMSQVINPGGIRAGCIYSINLRNFLTYKEVTLFPGKSLNLIIGPNGTGKSTFVSAIILGLGGSPSAIGSSDKLSDYVKTGCTEAKIDIELYQKPKQKNVIITMAFNIRNSSTWYINHETVHKKKVLELISSLHIQVENLCQFLPQNKVHEFAQKNPQERLRDTLATVWPQERVQQLDDLKDYRARQKELGSNLQKNKKELQELERRNTELKRDIDAMNERKKLAKDIEMCDVKKLWLEYQELKKDISKYDRDCKKQEQRKNNIVREVAPLKTNLESVQQEINGLEQKKQAVNTEIHNLKEQVKATINSIGNQLCEIEHIESEFKRKKERHENKRVILGKENLKLDKLREDKTSLEQQLGNLSNLQDDLNEIQRQIRTVNNTAGHLRSRKLQEQYEIDHNFSPQIRHCQNRIHNLQDVNKERLRILQRQYAHTYNAVMWLRENKDQLGFQDEVHEPMMLQINFTDPKYARYLEATVSARDLTAFTFESTSDMNLFLSHLRTQQDMQLVNAVQSKGRPMQSDDISRLRYLGFETYLVDTITAPDAILRYLCRQYNVHKIPIGNRHTYDNSDKVPQNITKFFTENHLFSSRISAYSGAKSSSTREITAARLLAHTVDLAQIDNLRAELRQVQRDEAAKRAEIQRIEEQLNPLETSLRDLKVTEREIVDCMNKIKSIDREIQSKAERLHDLENEATFDVEAEKAACKEKRKKCTIKQRKLHQELVGIVKGLQKKIINKELCSEKLRISRDAIVDKEALLRARSQECSEIEETLQRKRSELKTIILTAKEKTIQIKRRSDDKLPSEPGFPNKEAFDALPSDPSEIDERCGELRSRMSLLGPEDEQKIQQYEIQERRIHQLNEAVNNTSNKNKDLENNLKKIKSKWLPLLEELIQNINSNFSEMFARLNCAGEVKLVKEGGEDEFDKYGIDILVKFRAEEQLSRLTRHEQSGGERAISTAVYLMALQALSTDVPFRCVDEINQGMDAVNERRMLEMLVQVTTEGRASQYFLLTPKLLPNMKYNEKVTVHTIMNGQYIMNHKDWNYDSFLEKARRYRPS